MTTTRLTSREAYEALVSSGALKGQQERVLASLIRKGPSTSGELLAWMEIENVNAWRARFTELQARGLIQEVATRECKVTGRRALVWEFTGRTKPLNAKKGHRVDGKAWKALAIEAIECTRGEAREHLAKRAQELGA